MKLSICMMVKDEEENIERCLESLKPIVEQELGEIIVVDTGSTDSTVEIVKQYTDKVYFHLWNKDFSDMRNKTISYATGEWILIIDADERLNEIEALIEVLEGNELDNYNTATIQVKNITDNQDEGKYIIATSPRLFRNDKSFKYVGTVHNQPIYKKPILDLEISLTHYGYILKDKALMEKKYKRTVELLKIELEKDPENIYYLYQLGVSYDMYGDYKHALDAFRTVYDVITNKGLGKSHQYSYIMGTYARIAFRLERFNECCKVAKQVLDIQPQYVDMYYILGVIEYKRGNLKEAYEILNGYMELVHKYGELEIAKDLSIVMYYIGEEALSTAYAGIMAYYIQQEEYIKAYKVLDKLILQEHKLYYIPRVLLKLNKYEELREAYYTFNEEEERNTFLEQIESMIEDLNGDEIQNLYGVFKGGNNLYAKYCLVKCTESQQTRENLAKSILQTIDFNREPQFYASLFLEIEKIDVKTLQLLEPVERITIDNFMTYLIKKSNYFRKIIEQYFEDEIIENCDLRLLKVYIGIIRTLLLINLQENDVVDEKYERMFDRYIELGQQFIKQLYQMNYAEVIYTGINTVEERFFMQMYLAAQKSTIDKRETIKYILEAVKTYEVMAKYIDKYKSMLLEGDTDEEKKTKEFEQYQKHIKESINELLNTGQILDAEQLFDEYKKIVPSDIDNYSIEGVMAILKGKLEEAEKFFAEGLAREPYHHELLANQAYLMDITGRNRNAIENMSKAKLFNPDKEIKISDVISRVAIEQNNYPRIIHGAVEIANQMNSLTQGLRKLGAQAQSVNYWPNYLGYQSDIIMDISQLTTFEEQNRMSKELASKIIAENDVFHFHFGTSLTLDYSDLPLLNELGKKVVMQYWGSDVRLYSKAIQMNPYVKVKNMDEESIKRRLELVSKYVPSCIVDYELGEYVKDYFKNVHYTRVAMDLDKYRCLEEKNNKKLLIVHAPTSPEFKGSKYIIEAVEELQRTYDFEFKLVQGMKHEEAKKIYEQADLIIDQILTGSYGVFAVESMAMGKPVIAWISDFMREKYPKELPIISANPDTIKSVIEYVLNNQDMLREIGYRSREYVEKYHDMNKIATEMLQLYKGL